eukprot:1872078-Alexandrium_andersonii.AAC.2
MGKSVRNILSKLESTSCSVINRSIDQSIVRSIKQTRNQASIQSTDDVWTWRERISSLNKRHAHLTDGGNENARGQPHAVRTTQSVIRTQCAIHSP